VGVNNQYRGLSIDDFKSDLEFLLKKAIHFSGNKPERVIVISIPDWGVTPFAADREVKDIAREIDSFNSAKEALAKAYNITFIDITVAQRADAPDEAFITSDKLHPSGKEYEKWARLVSEKMKSVLKN
ncbi:MAG: hydrolase family protein, partial [Chitinophagaceae bacterium]|jgi:lysophospholipase L1-like esterase|nr:hydrolase family protein [Chitinophagaceae bacterium]